jgi:hypothetical protein
MLEFVEYIIESGKRIHIFECDLVERTVVNTTHIRTEPSFLLTKRIGAPHGLVLACGETTEHAEYADHKDGATCDDGCRAEG